MGKIVSAFACTHTLDPTHFPGEWKPKAAKVGHAVRGLGERLLQLNPDALIIIANDHYNAFSFRTVPAICMRVGHKAAPMKEYDMPLGIYDHLGDLRIEDKLGNLILEEGLHEGFDLALSWEAPLDHAFLEPIRFMQLGGRIPPLVPIWVNCLVAPQPSPQRCYRFGQLLGKLIENSPANVALLATGGMYHFPGLDIDRLSESHADFDREVLDCITSGRNEALSKYTIEQLREAGEHELLNWIVLAGAMGTTKAEVLSYELCEGLAGIGAVAWQVPS